MSRRRNSRFFFFSSYLTNEADAFCRNKDDTEKAAAAQAECNNLNMSG